MTTGEARLRDRALEVWFRNPAFLRRHLAFAGVFLISASGAPSVGLRITSPSAFVSSIVGILVITVVALLVPWPQLPRAPRLLVPLAGMVAVGLLRAGTGEAGSLYGLLVVLPALVLGAELRNPWTLLLVAVGADMVVFLPFLVLENPTPMSAALVVRALFSPFVSTMAAAGVYVLSRQNRNQITRLRELQDAYSGVIDAVTEQAIIATDPSGVIEVFNPGAERMLSVAAAATIGTSHITDFYLAEELDVADEEGRTGFRGLVAAAEAGRADVRDWTYLTANEHRIIVQTAVTPRYDRHRSVAGFLFVATDITQVREDARLKDEFLSLISHELRTPLSAILGYLELLRDDEDNPLSAEQVQYLTTVERNANRLLRLVGDLLFTAQVEAGTFALHEHEVDLGAVVSAAADTAMPAASTGGVQVESELPPAPVLVSGDAMRLGQACDNLVSNAVKFTPKGGQVRICLEVAPARGDTGAQAVISVRDTGYGIAAEEVEKLGTRFFRATTATRNAIAGVGLGLSITRAIVIAHHGTMDVESVEGTGTTFSIRLPLP